MIAPRPLFALLLVAGQVLGWTRPAPAALPPEAARLVAALQGLQGIRAEFEQIREVYLTGEQVEARGTLAFRPPHAFRLAYHSPETQELVIQGDTLWVITPRENQAQRFPYREDAPGNEIFLLFGGGRHPLDEVYEVTQEAWGSYPAALRLIPKNLDPGYPLEEVRVVVGKGGFPERLFFREVTGDTVVLHFTGFVRNPKDIEERVRLRLPPGIEIIDSSPGGTGSGLRDEPD